jgi:hypothetical protein
MRKTISFTCDEVTISSNRSTSSVLVYPNDANIDEIFEDLSITEIINSCDKNDLLQGISEVFTPNEILSNLYIDEIRDYLEDKGYSVKEGEE